jgi:hypothetical protein
VAGFVFERAEAGLNFGPSRRKLFDLFGGVERLQVTPGDAAGETTKAAPRATPAAASKIIRTRIT